MKKSLNIKIAGAAGEGIKSTGLILSKSFVRTGYQNFDYSEYPSLIRGGHNTYQTHIGLKQVYSQIRKVDLLIALNKEAVDLHQKELTASSLVIYDPGEFKLKSKRDLLGHYLPIPLIELAGKAGGKPVMANTVGLGAVTFLTGIDLSILKGVIREIFAKKSEVLSRQNQQVAQAGFDYAKDNLSTHRFDLSRPEDKKKKILLTGNEAVALGAVAGGMKFFAAYPMTPATSILHFLAAKARKTGLVVKHAEDEISVINMALGASFAGVRSMVATSGGGFALMSEALGMAGIMELPIVIVEAMRAGPSTGMPTWHDQGDLHFVLHASQGEFPRMVLAPGDSQEAFKLSYQAFYFAEKYQLPVIILSDKYLAESPMTMRKPKDKWRNSRFGFTTKATAFKRYQLTKNGISPRSIPGQKGGVHLSNSYDHDQLGYATEEIKPRNKMVEKRLRKLATLAREAAKVKQPLFGNLPAKIGIISWGSNKGPILQAIKNLKQVAFLHLNILWPFPKKQVEDFLSQVDIALGLECNATAQLADLIREQTGLEIKHKLLKYDGRPFYPEEIVEKIRKLA